MQLSFFPFEFECLHLCEAHRSLEARIETRMMLLSFGNRFQNKLTGTVPEWFGELSRLRGLVLGENRLRGNIPWQLGHLHKVFLVAGRTVGSRTIVRDRACA